MVGCPRASPYPHIAEECWQNKAHFCQVQLTFIYTSKFENDESSMKSSSSLSRMSLLRTGDARAIGGSSGDGIGDGSDIVAEFAVLGTD
mmetsp:Transcript_7901/g.18627  ORF Transcript_7901/g.18627 Transcript_7901/m.18627 type:complete len:89 (-) Transcript_7901:96-362(-)